MSAAPSRAVVAEQWIRCPACAVLFTLPITIPCPLDVWLAAMRGARCPKCAAGPAALVVYEPGRRPPELTPPAPPPELDPV